MIIFLLKVCCMCKFVYGVTAYEFIPSLRVGTEKSPSQTAKKDENVNRPKFRLDYLYEKAFDTFYKLHWTAATWEEAFIRCQAEGAELMVPSSLDEADAMPLVTAAILVRYPGIFVGLHDFYSERTFVTTSGSKVLNTMLSLLWEYTEPTHSAGRCVAMRRSGRFFVHPCDSPLPFVCKFQAKDINFNADCNSYDDRWILGPNNKCYFLHMEPQKWNQAYGTCLGAGGHLAIVTNVTEADYVKNLYVRASPRRIPHNNFAYLGFSDHFQRHHFQTVHGQSMYELGFQDWEETCDQGKRILNNTQCGGIRRSGLLATELCDTPAMFVCEKPADNVFNWKKKPDIQPIVKDIRQ